MRRTASVLIIGVLWALGALALPVAADDQTIAGVLVDPATYLQEGRYDADTVEMALDGGQSLALLEPKTQALYLLLAEKAGEDPNELVYDYLDQGGVTITGTVFERGGVRGLVPKSVAPVAGAAAPEASSPTAPAL